MASVDLAALKQKNVARWNAAKLTRASEFKPWATKAVANRSTYVEIEHRTGVPWTFVAVSHYRESTMDFSRSLAQGDPWNKKSVHVPAGRGPFSSFSDAAVDALVNCAPRAARLTDWTIGGMLTNLERFNGLGYARMGRPSAYIWSGTDQYVRGKYVADGKYDDDVVDKQLGCAGLILAMMQLDKTISFPRQEEIEVVYDGDWLQRSLNRLGYGPLDEDGIVGTKTRKATSAFQKEHGLTVDGKAGTVQTIPAIVAELARRGLPNE